MKRSLTTIWMAIAFVEASRELQRRSGIAAASWRQELREKAYCKLQQMSDARLVSYIKEHFDFD